VGARYIPNNSPNILIGWRAISQYMGVCDRALRRYEKREAFPACRLPDGRIMTSKSLIDQWILARTTIYRRQQSDEPEPCGLYQELTPDS